MSGRGKHHSDVALPPASGVAARSPTTGGPRPAHTPTTPLHVASTDDLIKANASFAEDFDAAGLAGEPARRVAIVACMDARFSPARALGLAPGDAHVIRNAGGIITDDVVRSLIISQRLLGTTEIVLIHHTRCGMVAFSDREVADGIEADTGVRPPFTLGAFDDVEDDLHDALRQVRDCPYLTRTESVRGFIYDVDTGEINEVSYR